MATLPLRSMSSVRTLAAASSGIRRSLSKYKRSMNRNRLILSYNSGERNKALDAANHAAKLAACRDDDQTLEAVEGSSRTYGGSHWLLQPLNSFLFPGCSA